MSDSVRPHRRQPTRLPCPWDSPGKNTGVGCHFLVQCMKVKSESEVAQSCPTLSDPMDCSLPGPSVHGIFQARVLEWGCHCLLWVSAIQQGKSAIIIHPSPLSVASLPSPHPSRQSTRLGFLCTAASEVRILLNFFVVKWEFYCWIVVFHFESILLVSVILAHLDHVL